VLLNYASRLTDVSFAGNIQIGTTRTISVGINKIPSAVYALDISGDLDVNGNVYLGMGTNFVGINTITPAYSLDVNGTINAQSIRVNGTEIGGSIPGYSANTFSFDTSFNGNVQIGNTTSLRSFGINRAPNPSYALDVNGTLNAQSILVNGEAISVSIPGYSGNTFSFDTSFNGNVQIGNTTSLRSFGINRAPNPSYALDVNGAINAQSILVNGTAITIPGYSANTFSFDTSFNGNVQIGNTTSLRSFGINRAPNPSYALDVNGTLNAQSILVNGEAISVSIPGYSANTFSFDTSFNGNVQIGNTIATRSLGINRRADPAYSLDVSGDVRIIETGPGTLASATTGTLVLSHTESGGRSSITFTSPNTGGDYGYIQYFDNSNSLLTQETSGGLMVLGVENRDGSGNTSDRISLYADAGTGNIGVNTLTPEYHLDVSGTLRYSAVSENLVPITASSNIISIVYGTGSADINGMVRYITSVTADLSLNISNLPLITNRSYVFTIIYNGGATTTTNYIKTVNLAFAGVPTFTTIIPKGTVTALTATTFFIQQFYVFIVSATIGSNIVFQTLTS
jgi:hypothetical protein